MDFNANNLSDNSDIKSNVNLRNLREDNKETNERQKIPSLLKNSRIILVFISVLLVITIIFIFLLSNNNLYHKSTNSNINKKKNIVTIFPTPSIIPSVANTPSNTLSPEKDLINRIQNELPKPRTQFNLSNWETFEDKEAGIRFKYPLEWGIPKAELSDATSSEFGIKGWTYLLTFNKNDWFQIEGSSRDFCCVPRGGVCYFDVFKTNKYPTVQDYCNSRVHYIYCQPIGNGLHLLTGSIRDNNSLFECGYDYYFKRSYLLNRPSKLISTMSFSGSFLSETYTDFFIENGEDIGGNSSITNIILQRKLDEESMKKFDQIEKLFETIEEI